MATLTELSKLPADRTRDESHYEQLLAVWRGLRESWPTDTAEAGSNSLFYAVSLAFFYKGQTDYPDLGEAAELLDALSQCLQLDPRDEKRCEEALTRLDSLPGIGLARASTILHCIHPDQFPIVDQNAAGTLCKWADTGPNWPDDVTRPTCKSGKMTQDPRAYLEYRRVLLALAAKSGLTLRQVEFALYNAGRKDQRVTGL